MYHLMQQHDIHPEGFDPDHLRKSNHMCTAVQVFAGLLVGAMLPYWFSAMTMKSVGKAALAMVEEVRRQFATIPGIMEGTARPDYRLCVEISTQVRFAHARAVCAAAAGLMQCPSYMTCSARPQLRSTLIRHQRLSETHELTPPSRIPAVPCWLLQRAR